MTLSDLENQYREPFHMQLTILVQLTERRAVQLKQLGVNGIFNEET